MEEELLQLREQNVSQQAIISQLLSYNSLLQQKLKQAGVEISPEIPVYTISQQRSTDKHSDDTTSQLQDGQKQVVLADMLQQGGIEEVVGIDVLLLSGTNQVKIGTILPVSGINRSVEPNTLPPDGINEPILSLPLRFEPSEANIGHIVVALRFKKLLRMNSRQPHRIARLLIHIYNRGGGTMNELAKVGGFPRKVIAQRIMNLRHKGLLVKDRVREHRLSNKALDILKEALKTELIK
jgi:hypothetical protein